VFQRKLGRSGIQVSGLGLGCWAIGGPAWRGEQPIGWSVVDDEESIRAIHRALDLGVSFFDTANVYGCGHSERVLGRALAGHRDEAVIATKFNSLFDEETKQASGSDTSPEGIRRACDDSLARLNVEYIDLYQFHDGSCELDRAAEVRDVLEELVSEGKIRYYGWSTDYPERARLFGEGEHCTAIQQRLNVLEGSLETLAVCEEMNLACINRTALGMGILTGKFSAGSKLPEDDVRRGWDFREGPQAESLERLERIRRVLTEGGRTLAQGALGWLWAKSDATIPIPGFKTVRQVEENVAAAEFGKLAEDQMARIGQLLGASESQS